MDISFIIDSLERVGVDKMILGSLSLLLIWWYFTIKYLWPFVLSFFPSQPQRKIRSITFTLSTILFISLWTTWNPPKVIKYTGTLTPNPDSIQPSSSPLFPHPKKEKLPTLEFGDTCSVLIYIGKERGPIFTILEKYPLTVQSNNGQIKISTQLFNQDGHLVAEINENVWEVAKPPTSYRFNYTDEALEVIDARDQVILQVRVLPDRIQLQGEWWNEKGDGIRIAKSADRPEPSIVWLAKGEDRFLKEVPPIKRIFKYPAEEHLGETIAPLPQAPHVGLCVPLDATQRTIVTPWFPLPEFPAPRSGLHGHTLY